MEKAVARCHALLHEHVVQPLHAETLKQRDIIIGDSHAMNFATRIGEGYREVCLVDGEFCRGPWLQDVVDYVTSLRLFCGLDQRESEEMYHLAIDMRRGKDYELSQQKRARQGFLLGGWELITTGGNGKNPGIGPDALLQQRDLLQVGRDIRTAGILSKLLRFPQEGSDAYDVASMISRRSLYLADLSNALRVLANQRHQSWADEMLSLMKEIAPSIHYQSPSPTAERVVSPPLPAAS